MGAADDAWTEMLGRWAIPDEILAAAPVTPHHFDPAVFTASADDAIARGDDTVSDARAREALPPGGSVLDVGSGAGAASLRLGARSVVAVDQSRPLLDAFTDRAEQLGVEAYVVEGRWPAVASQAPVADVVVCHHVFYNVPDLAAFASALWEHARRRVVVELTGMHPMTWLSPYWAAMHGVARPDRPTAEDALAVLCELGLEPAHARWQRRMSMIGEGGVDDVARIARRLCIGEERHDELRTLLQASPPPVQRDVVTIWW